MSPFAALPPARQRSIHRLWRRGKGIYPLPPLPPPTPPQCADSLLQVDWPTLIINFLVSVYFSTLELIIMNQGHSFPPPSQMRNGGSPSAHLPPPLRIPTDPSGWLQHKWSHTPPRAPDCLFSSYQAYNPPANACNEDWFDRAYPKDHQAAGLLPQEAPIVREACGISKHADQVWKGAIDQLWEALYHHQQDLDKSTTDE